MMPIKPVLEDIKQKFKTTDVRLLKRGEIESLTVSSKVSETLTVAEEDSQAPSSDSGRTSKPAAVSLNFLALKNIPKLENLLGVLLEKFNHPSNWQEDKTINEKSLLESIPMTLMATQAAPQPEPSGNMNEVNKLTTSCPGSPSSPVAHDILLRYISLELTRPVNACTLPLVVPIQGLDWRSEILPVRLLEPARLPSGGLLSVPENTYTAPYIEDDEIIPIKSNGFYDSLPSPLRRRRTRGTTVSENTDA
jgi:hypothetical protein